MFLDFDFERPGRRGVHKRGYDPGHGWFGFTHILM